jgi:hypothetical protein
MLNFNGIVMATGRIFSMSGINTGHHYLPTYQILMISENVEFLPPIFMPCFGSHFENGKIQHCSMSSKFDMWVDNDVPN